MKSLIATIALLLYTPALFAQNLSGKFEQVELISQYMPSKELQELAIKKFQEEKFILEFSDGKFEAYRENDLRQPMNYRIEGKTIIAKIPGMDQYWILYVHDDSTIYSSGMKFIRVEP